jgi:hypothetical protein
MTIDLKQEQSSPAKEVHLMSFAELSTVLAQETKAIKQRPFDELSWRSSSITRIEDFERVEIKITKLHSELVEKEITELNNKFYNATSELKSLAQILPEIEKIICDYHMLRGLEDNPRKAVLSMENRDSFESAKMQFIKLRTQDSSFTIEEILAAESDFFDGISIKAKNDLPKIQNTLVEFQTKISDQTKSCILKFQQLEPCFGAEDNLNEITDLNELIDQINQNIQRLDLNSCLTSYQELIPLVQTIEDYVSELVKVWESGDWVLPKNSRLNIGKIIDSEQKRESSNNPKIEKKEALCLSETLLDNPLTLKTYTLLARALDADICYLKKNPRNKTNLSKIERKYRTFASQEVENQIAEILTDYTLNDLIDKISALAGKELNIAHLEAFIKTRYLEPQNNLRRLLSKYELKEELINKFIDNHKIVDAEQLVFCLKFSKKILPVFVSKLESYPELSKLNVVELGEYLHLLKKVDGYIEKLDDSAKEYLMPNSNTYESIENLKNYAEILHNLDLDPTKLVKLKNEKDFLKIKSIISDNFSKFNDHEILLTFELLLFAFKIDTDDSNSSKKVSELIKAIKTKGEYHTQTQEQLTASLIKLLQDLETAKILIKTTSAKKEKDCKFKLNLNHDLIKKLKAEVSINSESLDQKNTDTKNSKTEISPTFLLSIQAAEKQTLASALEQIMQLLMVITECDYLLTRARDYFTLKFHIPDLNKRILDFARNDKLLKKNTGIKRSFEDFCLKHLRENTDLLSTSRTIKSRDMLRCLEICFTAYTTKEHLKSAYQVIDILINLQGTLIKLAKANPQIKFENYSILTKFDQELNEAFYEENELKDRKSLAAISKLIEIFKTESSHNSLIDGIAELSKLLPENELVAETRAIKPRASIGDAFND